MPRSTSPADPVTRDVIAGLRSGGSIRIRRSLPRIPPTRPSPAEWASGPVSLGVGPSPSSDLSDPVPADIQRLIRKVLPGEDPVAGARSVIRRQVGLLREELAQQLELRASLELAVLDVGMDTLYRLRVYDDLLVRVLTDSTERRPGQARELRRLERLRAQVHRSWVKDVELLRLLRGPAAGVTVQAIVAAGGKMNVLVNTGVRPGDRGGAEA
jgi:hypothetical protein